MSSYAAEVRTGHGTDWSGNALRFATETEAKLYVNDLCMRWLSVTDTRVVESQDPVTHAWKDGRVHDAHRIQL